MVLGKLPVPGRPTIWMIVGQGPIALAGDAGGGGSLDMCILLYPFSPLSPSLWETARYRLKYCLKGPLSPKQPINQFVFSCPGSSSRLVVAPGLNSQGGHLWTNRQRLSPLGRDKWRYHLSAVGGDP